MSLVKKIGQRLFKNSGAVLTRLIPDINERKQLKTELERVYIETIQDELKLYEFEPKISMFLKGSTRWIIALIMTFFYIYLRLSDNEITEFDQWLMAGLWGFMFILRSIEKIKRRDK